MRELKTFDRIEIFKMTERTRSNTFESVTDKVEARLDSGLDAEPNNSSPEIECSLNPEEVRIGTTYINVEQLVSQIRNGKIYWDSDVQRAFAWQPEYQSRLIESVLLRIPIPVFYVAAGENNNWSVVDGVQRLSAIYSYVTDEFPLNRLEYFVQFNGKRYSDLPRAMQRRIGETQLTVHSIEAGTPEHIKSNILRRINPRRCDVDEATKPSSRITNVPCVDCV